MIVKCSKCGKPMKAVKHTFVPQCACSKFTVPISAGKAKMSDGRIVSVEIETAFSGK